MTAVAEIRPLSADLPERVSWATSSTECTVADLLEETRR